MRLLDYLKSMGYEPINGAYYARIDQWRSWYQGKVRGFHRYSIYNAGKRLPRERAGLNMAKQGCEYWANLIWNHECFVNLRDGTADKVVNDVLQDNDFWRQTNVLIERAWALGCGAYVAYNNRGRAVIDYVTADSVFPLSWRNDDIESCAFAASYNEGAKRLLYLMVHEKNPESGYTVSNYFFEWSKGGDLRPHPTPTGIMEQYTTKKPHFAIVKPNIANNIADVPMGMSIYANCIDTLKSIDLAYDGAKTAMEIGRPRIGVSSNMIGVDETTGEPIQVFEANDIAVYNLGMDMTAKGTVEVKDLTTQYRAAEYEQSLRAQLAVYAQQIGLGENAFKWVRAAGDVAKTATEVVSQNSTMLRAMEKHQNGLRSSITQIVRAVLEMQGLSTEQEITIVFDDSATRDKTQEAKEAWQWVVSGMYPFWRYLVEYKGYDQKDAMEIAAGAAGGAPLRLPGDA